MAHHVARPAPMTPGSPPVAPFSRNGLQSEIMERTKLISSGGSSHHARLPSSPAAGRSAKEQRLSMQCPLPPVPPQQSRRSAYEPTRHSMHEMPALPPPPPPTGERKPRPGPPPKPKKNNSVSSLREMGTPREAAQLPPRQPSAPDKAVARQPLKPVPAKPVSSRPAAANPATTKPLPQVPVSAKPKPATPSHVKPVTVKPIPPKPAVAKPAVLSSRDSMLKRTPMTPPPTKSKVIASTDTRRQEQPVPTQHHVQSYPPEDLYEVYDEEMIKAASEDLYEMPQDDPLMATAPPLPGENTLYTPMDIAPEVMSFGHHDRGMFDSSSPTLARDRPMSTPFDIRSPPPASVAAAAAAVAAKSSHLHKASPKSPPPVGLIKSSSAPLSPPLTASKPKGRPPVKPKGSRIAAQQRFSVPCFSEPNSPQIARLSAGNEEAIMPKGLRPNSQLGSADSILIAPDKPKPSFKNQPKRLPQPPPGRDQSGEVSFRPSRSESNVSNVLRQLQSNSGRQSPRAGSPSVDLGNDHQSSRSSGRGYTGGAVTPSSAVGGDNVSEESESLTYDDVVLDSIYDETQGPLQPPFKKDIGGVPLKPLRSTSVGEWAGKTADTSGVYPRRMVERVGPRISVPLTPALPQLSPYQAPDRQSMSSEEYTPLCQTWSDAQNSTAGSLYERDEELMEDLQSVYQEANDFRDEFDEFAEDTYDEMSHVDIQCRAATLRASKGYMEEVSKGLLPPGDPPPEIADIHASLDQSELYSVNGKCMYQGFIKTGLDAVRFYKFPSYIHGRSQRFGAPVPGGRRAGSSSSESPEDRQYQFLQLAILHEEIYNYTLRLFVERFVNARDFSPDLPDDLRIMDKSAARSLFNNVEQLYDASTRLLSALKRRQRAQQADLETVSDLYNFILSDSLCKLYMTYSTNHIYQTRTLDELNKDNTLFSRQLAILETDRSNDLGGNNFASFLSVPISYITYLSKYLKALAENIPPGAVSIEQRAADAAVRVCKWCDEAAQTVNRTEQLVRTEHQLDFSRVKHIPLVSQSRRLIRTGPIKMVDMSNPSAPHRLDAHLLVFNDLIMVAKPKGIMSTIKRLGSDKTLKVLGWCDRQQVDVETGETEIMDMSTDTAQPKTLRGGFTRHIRSQLRKEAAVDTSLAFKLMWEGDGEVKEFLMESLNMVDRERWMTALDNEAAVCGRAVESVYEDAEITHYEVVTDYVAKETDELTLTVGSTIIGRRKAPDGWCFGEDHLTGRVGWFHILNCRTD